MADRKGRANVPAPGVPARIMPTDQNPWNIGGGNRPPSVPPTPPNGGPWGGGSGPHGRLPPDIERFLLELRHLWRRLMGAGPGGVRGLVLAAFVLGAIWLSTGFYRVEPDEQGLVLRFGAFVRGTPPGLNYHLPWPVESALLLPVTRINRVEIGFRGSDADEQDPSPRPTSGVTEATPDQPDRDLREESLMLTGDENIVDINASVFWRISNAAAYAFNTRNPAGTVKAASESVLRQVLGHTKIQSALTEGRAAIEQGVTTGAQAILDQYKSGVEITQVQLQKVDPPAEVIESFRDVQRANTEADRARNEAQSYANDIVPRARGDAAAIIANAEGDKLAAVAKSQGEAQRFLSVFGAYSQAKDVTLKRLYIETMQDVVSHAQTTVVDDKLRGVLPMLNLSQPGAGAVK
jgi:membrane protease subunit HflK